MSKSWLTIDFYPLYRTMYFPTIFRQKINHSSHHKTPYHIRIFMPVPINIFYWYIQSKKTNTASQIHIGGIPPFKIFDILKIFKLVVIAHFTTAQKHCIFNVFNLYYISIVSISPISIHPVRGGIFTYFTWPHFHISGRCIPLTPHSTFQKSTLKISHHNPPSRFFSKYPKNPSKRPSVRLVDPTKNAH